LVKNNIVDALADEAFDSGAVVVAAVGNGGPAGLPHSPATARKVISVGALGKTQNQMPEENGYQTEAGAWAACCDILYQDGESSQYCGEDSGASFNSKGPLPDGRCKPEILCPTFAKTADWSPNSPVESWDEIKFFGGTSGAAPFATGAAVLLLDLFRQFNWALNPGAVYAALIASGPRPWPQFVDDPIPAGVGKIVLPHPVGAGFLSGARTVFHGECVDIEFFAPVGASNLRAAIWWPEEPQLFINTEGYVGNLNCVEYHNRILLSVISPKRLVVAESKSKLDVFQFAMINNKMDSGVWRVRLIGEELACPQVVYYFLWFKMTYELGAVK